MDLNKKHWLIDVSLIVIIIVMGIFVALELNRTIAFMRQQANPPSSETAELIPETVLSNSNPERMVEEPTSSENKPIELFGLNGETTAFSEFIGTPMLVNFWATWCPPCLEEMPLIQEYADRYGDELIVLAINAGEDEAAVRNFVLQHQFELNFILDPTNTVTRQFRVYGFPTTLFFDEAGDLISTHIGVLNAELIDRYLLKIGIGE